MHAREGSHMVWHGASEQVGVHESFQLMPIPRASVLNHVACHDSFVSIVSLGRVGAQVALECVVVHMSSTRLHQQGGVSKVA